LEWRSGVAVALDGRIDAIPVDSALTGVNAGIVSGPKVLSVSIFVVPPTVSDAVQFQRGVETIVLITSYSENGLFIYSVL
jgi:hypothetical protein